MRLPPEGPVRPEPGACPMLETQADALLGGCNSMGLLFCLGWRRGSGHEAGWLGKLSGFV